MTSPAELRFNRRNTAAFVDVKPTTLVLTPQRRVRTATGGFQTANDPDRRPQQFRILDLTGDYLVNQPPQRTIDGIERSVEFELISYWDAELALFDTWTDADGVQWELTAIHPDNGYERRATVVRYGD